MKVDAHRAWPAFSKEVVVTDRAPKSRRLAYHNECARVNMDVGYKGQEGGMEARRAPKFPSNKGMKAGRKG